MWSPPTCEPGSIDIIGALIFGARTQENSVAVRRKEVCASVFALQTLAIMIGDNEPDHLVADLQSRWVLCLSSVVGAHQLRWEWEMKMAILRIFWLWGLYNDGDDDDDDDEDDDDE